MDVAQLVKEYQEADALLTSRITDKRFGYDTYDKIYQTYLDPNKWPYSVKLATPRGFTALFNKTTRIVGGKFTGKVEAMEENDEEGARIAEEGARIASEHLRYSVERFNQYSDQSLEVKTAIWDTNTRLYGAGFLRAYWKVEYKTIKVKGKKKTIKVYDNWWLDVLNNRDVLTQPGRENFSDSDYVIVRRYVTPKELERIQEDGAGYDKGALAEIKSAKSGSGKDANYVPIIKLIKGQSYSDERIEVCTTYYKDKFITWCPKHGTKGAMDALILREMENPYRHQTIPIVPLVYIPSQEDVIGMSELQPVTALLKIMSALQSQIIETVNMDLKPIVLVNPTGSRMDTFKYRSPAFWLVNDVNQVRALDKTGSRSLAEFSQIYQMIVTEFLEAMGETGTGVSQVDILGGDKTATEVDDRAYLRGARDNFNKMMLSSALKKLMYLLFEMLRDPKFTSNDEVIRIVGKDALEYFDKQGYSSWGINDEGYQLVFDVASELERNKEFSSEVKAQGQDIYTMAYQLLMNQGALDQFAEPISPVMTAKGMVEKMKIDTDRNVGYLHVNPESDYEGEYNFIPDVEALVTPSPEREYQARTAWYNQVIATEKMGLLQQEGYTFKHKDVLSKMAEYVRIKNAEQYFEEVKEENGVNQAGAGAQGGMPGGQGISGQQAIPGNQQPPIPPTEQGVPQTQPQGMGGAVPLR